MIVFGDACPTYPWVPITLAQQLRKTAERYGERDAFVSGDQRLTWTETLAASRRLAKGLLAAKIQPGDHIALWVPNRVEWVLMWLAAAHVGAVIVPINTRYKQLGFALSEAS